MIDARQVVELRRVLQDGEVVLVPTDTVYGLAAALDSVAGVEALYALKGRPRTQPCQVLLLDESLLDEALRPLDRRTASAVRALVPGTTTCLVSDPAGRYAAAAGAEPGSVGLRVPVMPPEFAGFDLALIATSANEPGQRDPAVIDDVPAALRAQVGRVLDAGRLPGTASAVVDLRPLATTATATLVRPGPSPDGVRSLLADLGIQLVAPD